MQERPEHVVRATRLVNDEAPPSLPGSGVLALPAAAGYLKAVEQTTSYNEGFLYFEHEGGLLHNADTAYALIGSEPGKRHASVEVDGLYLPADMRAIAYGLLVHADELEGR